MSEQDQDGIDAEVMFTSVSAPSMWRALPDEGYLACIHAYNEFLADEYCAAGRDRLLAMGVMPTSGIDDALRELEYCKKAGLKGVALQSFPSGKSFPSSDDDRFWQAALDMLMPLTIHVGFLASNGPIFKYSKQPTEAGFGADPIRLLTRFQGGSGQIMIQLMFSGVFERFPRLRFYFAETMVGWLPYTLEQVDDIYARSQYWAEREYGLEPLPRPPSDYMLKHAVWGFLRDPFGVRMRHEYGVTNAMWGSDFPHSAGNFPHSRQILDEMFGEAPDNERYAMTAGNAVDFFGLDNEV